MVNLNAISYKCVKHNWWYDLTRSFRHRCEVSFISHRTKITHTHPDTPTTSNTQLHSSKVSVASVSRYHLFWVSNMSKCGKDTALPVFGQRGAELPQSRLRHPHKNTKQGTKIPPCHFNH